jgi:SNF2 family DNA or RNA helicase
MLRVKREQSFSVKHEAFAYQLQAVETIKELEYAAIFHEQGLGKTKIAIDLSLLWIKSNLIDSVLIITKKGLIENWRQEIENHAFVAPQILDQDRNSNFHAFNSPARIYLAHYEVCRSELKRLKLFQKTRRLAVILDESQKIKNPDSSLTKCFFELSEGFVRRVVMTGTPIANRPYDIWSQIWFLDHGKSLGTDFNSFRDNLDLSNELGENKGKTTKFEEELSSLFSKIGSFSVRETKKSSGLTLPNKQIDNVLVNFEGRQFEIYKNIRDELKTIVVKNGVPVLDESEELLKRILRLVQVASNPVLIDEAYHDEPGKFPYLLNLLYEAIDGGSKAIIWTSFTGNANWLTSELSEFNAVKVHGKLSIDDRNRAIKRFKENSDCKVLVATPGAAKEGLTLTVANYAIFYDRTFSLDDYLQAQDRIHRISQEKACYVYNLIMRDSVDEWVDVLLNAKHLAAQLGQGDIDKENYGRNVSYEFGRMLRQVLAIDDESSVT